MSNIRVLLIGETIFTQLSLHQILRHNLTISDQERQNSAGARKHLLTVTKAFPIYDWIRKMRIVHACPIRKQSLELCIE